MTPRFVGTLILIIALASFITGYVVYPNLPLMAVSHWNSAGQANGMLGRAWAAFLLPGLMIILLGLWWLLPLIDPIAPGYKSFRYVYDFIMFLVVAFLAYVYALSLGANLGWQVNMPEAVLPAVGVLIFALGALMPYLRRNWFVGIRTPWTISSERVWDKTHRLGAKLFELSGVIIFAAAFLYPAGIAWWIVVPLLLAIVITVVYSYLLYARERG